MAAKFKIGDKVLWNDPQAEPEDNCSAVYTVNGFQSDDDEEEDDLFEDRIYYLSNEHSELEALEDELELA